MDHQEQLDTANDRIALLEAALASAGAVSRSQAEMLDELQGTRRQLTNELWDWKQRCQSLSERLAEVYPPEPTAREFKQMQDLVRELEQRLAHAAAERRQMTATIDSQARALEEWSRKYQGSEAAVGRHPMTGADPTVVSVA